MATRVFDIAESIVVKRTPEEIFAKASDLPGLIAKARAAKAVEFERLSGDGALAAGNAWKISGETRLGHRTGMVTVTEASAPERLAFRSEGRGFAVDTVVTMTPAGAGACRLSVANDVEAVTLAARLLAPGMRLWRRRARKGLKKGLKRLKRRLEA